MFFYRQRFEANISGPYPPIEIEMIRYNTCVSPSFAHKLRLSNAKDCKYTCNDKCLAPQLICLKSSLPSLFLVSAIIDLCVLFL